MLPVSSLNVCPRSVPKLLQALTVLFCSLSEISFRSHVKVGATVHLATGAGLEYSGSPCCVIMEVPVFSFLSTLGAIGAVVFCVMILQKPLSSHSGLKTFFFESITLTLL